MQQKENPEKLKILSHSGAYSSTETGRDFIQNRLYKINRVSVTKNHRKMVQKMH